MTLQDRLRQLIIVWRAAPTRLTEATAFNDGAAYAYRCAANTLEDILDEQEQPATNERTQRDQLKRKAGEA